MVVKTSKQNPSNLVAAPTLDTWVWNSAISLPSMLPNLLSTSLCHESYFSVTLDWTCSHKRTPSSVICAAKYPNSSICMQLLSISKIPMFTFLFFLTEQDHIYCGNAAGILLTAMINHSEVWSLILCFQMYNRLKIQLRPQNQDVWYKYSLACLDQQLSISKICFKLLPTSTLL